MDRIKLKYFKKDVILLIVTYIVLAAAVGVFFPFNAVYLRKVLEFSNSQISFIDGIGQFAAIFFLPLAGILSDKTKKPGLTFIVLMSASGVLMLFYANANSFVYVSFLYIGYLMLRRGVFPILDALALNVCERHELDFGFFRSIYSGFFMLFAIMAGNYLKNQDSLDNTFIYLSVIFNLFVIILAFFLPKFNFEHTTQVNLKVDVKNLLLDKKFILVSIAISLAMATVSIISMYNSILIDELGGSLQDVGFSTIMQMGSEVIFALYAFKLVKRYSHLNVLLFGLGILLLRWLLVILFYSYSIYYYTIWIEGFATIFILIVGMDYVKSLVKSHLIATSITVYTSITLFFYAILVNFSGYLKDNFNNISLFIFLFVTTFVGTILLILIKKKYKS